MNESISIIPQIIANSMIAGSIYALLALGFNLIYGTVRFFDLGYGALTAVGGYMMFLFFKTLDLPLWLAGIFSLLISGLVGLLIYLLVYKPMRTRRSSSTVILVASLGVLTMVQAIVAIFFSSQFRTLAKQVGIQHIFRFWGMSITLTQVIIFVSTILIMVALGILLYKTTFGRAVRAIGDDEDVAKIVGVNTKKIIGWVFFIGSTIAGLAGIFVGFDTGIEPTMGLGLLLKAVVAIIIGGVGNVYGGVAGAFLLGFIENFGILYISGEWKDAIAFIVLILFLLFRPQGIFPAKGKRK